MIGIQAQDQEGFPALIEPRKKCYDEGQDLCNDTKGVLEHSWLLIVDEKKYSNLAACKIVIYGVEWKN